MTKELEALKWLKTTLKSNSFIYGDLSNDISIQIIEQALRTPTADEVCEALKAHYKEDVIFDGDSFWDCTHKYLHANKTSNGDVLIRYQLPIHLITLIGRFYEGLEK